MDHGADINIGDGIASPLQLATRAYQRNTEQVAQVVQILLERGADVNLQSQGSGGDFNALETAERGGNATVVRMLLENGAEVSCCYRGESCCPALKAVLLETHHFAAFHGDLAPYQTIERMLRDKGAIMPS